MAGAKAVGFLDLDASGFNTAIKAATGALVALGAAFASYKVGDFFVQGIKEAVNFGNEMGRVAARMGHIDPGKLLLMQKALENSGLSAGEAQAAIEKLIASGKPFSSLFLNAGGAGSALAQASKDYGGQADALTKSSQQLMLVWNTIQSISSKVKTFFMTMTAEFVDPLRAAIILLNNTIQLGDFGKKFGSAIRTGVEILVGAFKNDTIFQILAIRLKLAFNDSYNYLAEKFKSMKEMFGGPKAVDMFAGAKDIFIGLGKILKGYMIAGSQAAVNMAIEGPLHNAWANTQRIKSGIAGTSQNIEAHKAQDEMKALAAEIDLKAQLIHARGGSVDQMDEVLRPLRKRYEEANDRKIYAMGGDKEGNMTYGERVKMREARGEYATVNAGNGQADMDEGISQIAKGGQAFGKAGEDFSKAISIITGSEDPESLRAKGKVAEDKAEAEGKAMIAKILAGDSKPTPLNYSALESSGGYSTISSSMAKIGGGGGYIQNTLSAEAKEMQKMNRAADRQLEVQKEIAVNTLPKNQYLKLAD
jgi:hypothetical protein